MDQSTADVVANRDEPIPEISFSVGDGDTVPSESQSKRENLKTKFSASYQKERLRDVRAKQQEKKDSGAPLSLQDRLFAKLLQQVIPAAEVEDEVESAADRRSSGEVKRPAFGLPLMTNNFRRFNARIGIVFVFQNRLLRLFSWRKPTHTISFLFAYSFVCLDPYLLIILPIATLLLFIMVPAFLARHPPPPSTSTSSTTPYYSYEGPALAPARTIKPASETSKDFFRNMRDLQNCMADFANMHDATVSLVSPPTNFSDENLSSTLFLVLYVITALLFLTAHLLPWRFIFLFGGNAAIIANHPSIQAFFQKPKESMEEKADGSNGKFVIFGFSLPSSRSSLMSFLDSAADITLDSYPEEREVEVFELQYRPLPPYSASTEWEHFLFTPTPYDPLSPSRIAGDRPRGCRFFEDVQPPSGWAWKSKKWELDLDCREWVVERMVTGVGFEAPDETFGGSGTGEEVGGWVWDLSPNSHPQDADEDINSTVYGDLKEPNILSKSGRKGKSKTQDKGKAASRDWEEGAVNSQGTGEWRRRRWVRLVQRVSVPTVEGERDVDTDRD